ncbi:MAG TPA: hypothetical protein VNA21_11585, partial [Steroidobacteraceae bacterium]|nr:hypothetical protein [Steroidobacteraceae bacterium]
LRNLKSRMMESTQMSGVIAIRADCNLERAVDRTNSMQLHTQVVDNLGFAVQPSRAGCSPNVFSLTYTQRFGLRHECGSASVDARR